MMKSKVYIIVGILAILNFSSCSDLLNVVPLSSITGEVYFQNEGDFEPNLTGIYTSMRGFTNNVTYGTERGEELTVASNSRFSVAWSQVISPANGSLNYGSWYQAIGHCNLLLDKIEAFPFASNPDQKSRIKAETYALRAFFYFQLARIIGDTPLMLQSITDDNVPLLPRSPLSEVMKQIFSDVEAASQLLKGTNNFSVRSFPSKYRFNYAAIQALKADAKLWSAKVANGGQTDLTDAIAAIAEVEASGVSLNADFKNVVGLRANFNPEVILSAFYTREEGGNNYVVNALPFINILSGALNLDSIPYTISSGNGQGAYQISPLSRSLFAKNPEDKRIPHTWILERDSKGPKIAWISKYPGTRYSDDRFPDNDLIIYRFADILLMKAEAFAGINDFPKAIEALNRVKVRASILPYSGEMNKISIEKEILDERGRELFFENKRWFDLVRFHKGGTINVYQYVPNLIGKTTPLFWPLNNTVLGANNLITQTEGY
jgi:hypothetical protein